MRLPGILLVLLACLGACSHTAKKVDCDKHLVPVNPPTPMLNPSPTPKTPAP